jgi:zinc D-Ala-D-Ala carboxypeptidase
MDKYFGHFTLDELTYSEWADAHDVENIPNAEQIENIKTLCDEVLNPIREHFKCAVYINSCFRTPFVNEKIGSKAKNSQHLCNNGRAAADIHVRAVAMRDFYKWIK